MLPSIETERLLLRPPSQADFDDGWAELHGDDETMRYLGGPQPRSIAWRALAQVAGMWPLLGFGQFSAVEKATGRWVGRVGPWRPEGWPAPEVGWMFNRSTWGRGYASEAARACMDFAFGPLGWADVAHMIHPDNAPSLKLAQRLGSSLLDEVRLPPPFDDRTTQMWGQSAQAWRQDAGR